MTREAVPITSFNVDLLDPKTALSKKTSFASEKFSAKVSSIKSEPKLDNKSKQSSKRISIKSKQSSKEDEKS